MANVFDLIEIDDERNILRVKQATKDGYLECCANGCFDGSYASSLNRRGRVQGGGANRSRSHLRSRKLPLCF